MQQNSIHILCTRPISGTLMELASEAGIVLDVIPFIETEAVQSIEVQQEIEQALLLTATVVFTSGSAVEVVAAELEGQDPDWEIFCIGHRTKELVAKHFGEQHILGIADNAVELAEQILDVANTDEVIFFCGDQRREELPQLLREKGIEVDEIIVYQTILLPQRVKKNYEAVLFFSPTAVNSFFELNKAAEKTVFFAIGNTTATEIKKNTKNKIVVSDEPAKDRLVEMAVEYFT